LERFALCDSSKTEACDLRDGTFSHLGVAAAAPRRVHRNRKRFHRLGDLADLVEAADSEPQRSVDPLVRQSHRS
jgi:hypothetical protein